MKHALRWQKVMNIGKCWNKKVFILPGLSNEDALKENLILKIRRELLDQGVLAEKLKICNLELFNEGKKVEIKTEGAKSDWLGFLNILQFNTRSLINIDRRMKFSNAVLTSSYNVMSMRNMAIWKYQLSSCIKISRTPPERLRQLSKRQN